MRPTSLISECGVHARQPACRPLPHLQLTMLPELAPLDLLDVKLLVRSPVQLGRSEICRLQHAPVGLDLPSGLVEEGRPLGRRGSKVLAEQTQGPTVFEVDVELF